MDSVRTLLTEIVDYAGLFPPAGLGMAEAVSGYDAARRGAYSWMLGRFVCPLRRIEEFEDAAYGLLPREAGEEAWRVSALVDGGKLEEEIDAIFAFNSAHEEGELPGRVAIDAIEVKVPGANADGARFVDEAMRLVPEQLDASFELPLGYDLRGLVAALAGSGGRAKVRTGGVTADLVPSAEAVAEFVVLCAQGDVGFKATAGLHEALRGERALTYAEDAPRSVMHGFLNVFLMAAFVKRGRMEVGRAVEVLEERSGDGFVFADGGVEWNGRRLTTAQLASARESFATSFGSCSFDEPVESLKAIGLLPIGEEAAG